MMEKGEFTLPGGAFDAAGVRHQGGLLRALTGADEEWLLGQAASTRHAGLVTEVLARCVEQLGPDPVTRELVRDLGVGDRDYLLLRLRTLSFGAKLWRVVTCPMPGCAAKMDLDLVDEDLPVHERPAQASHRTTIAAEPALLVEFRVPRGREQEQVAALPSAAPEALRERLLEACVLRVRRDDDGAEVPFAALSPGGKDQIARAIEEVAPGVGLEAELVCPECGRGFDIELDPMALLIEEIARDGAALERELHLLAFHYHWSLGEMLGLTLPRRRRFLRLLVDELDARAGRAST
jgi:hypothetical protein